MTSGILHNCAFYFFGGRFGFFLALTCNNRCKLSWMFLDVQTLLQNSLIAGNLHISTLIFSLIMVCFISSYRVFPICPITSYYNSFLLHSIVYLRRVELSQMINNHHQWDELNWVKWLIIIIINGGILSPDRLPPLSSQTKTHHGGNLSWWEYAGRPIYF